MRSVPSRAESGAGPIMHLLLKTDKGDWLQHEDSVAMRRMPLWLSEGMADALAMDISEQEHLI